MQMRPARELAPASALMFGFAGRRWQGMARHRWLGALALCGALLGVLPHAAAARDWVSVRGEGVNMRARPSQSAQVLWQLGSGYPLRVLERKGGWVRVVDFEADRGWVAARFTGRVPHVVVRTRHANVRKGPGTRHTVLRQAVYGEVFRVLDRRPPWVRVRDGDGRTGWIARRLLWGP
jgi:SH3-like domain-containing protein